MQGLLITNVIKILDRAGYVVTDLAETKPRCFDIVARREDTVLFLKVLYNIDSFKQEMAKEMKIIAKALKASPIVIGERYKADFLERGVVYTRYGIPVINTATFYDIVVDNELPLIYSAPGGYYVKLDSEKIKKVREEKGLSAGELAMHLGISRRTVMLYEEGIDTNVENAIKLEEILGECVVKEIDIFNFVKDDEGEVAHPGYGEREEKIIQDLKEIGVDVIPVKHAPFDVISKPENEPVLTGIKQVREIDKRVDLMGRISRIISTMAAYIVEKKVKVQSDNVVIVMKEELSCVSNPKDFYNLLEEKKDNRAK
ncbi:transcriptional regulator [Geoglobus acetivorans]|uniref:Putative HTH-type transcriptional regulatory protein LPQ35_01780 n=1 Tax=Geoglobus acetivorans TaxID=565033 RepID=A0ABZ3H6Q2_GEOAI|nr:transcriptional regulator [Geoglobus acetivorans]